MSEPTARELSDRFAHPAPGDWFAELFADAPVISVYTRTQALADGELVDAGPLAREAGFLHPVALTRAAWADTVAWDEHTEKGKPQATGQDETGRLWDVLWMTRHAIRAHRGDTDRVRVTLHRVPATGRGLRPARTELVAVVGPGDHGEPVITVMLPTED